MAFELNEQDCVLLEKDLQEFLRLSEAQAAMLCDRGGAILLKEGEAYEESLDLIAALVAGSYAATKELASALGENEFNAIFHQGANTGIFISSVASEVLLLAIFTDVTNTGLVKMYAESTGRKMQGLFKEISDRDEVESDDETVSFVINKEGKFF